eukprot:TRINITY_DN7309_c0_g1_i1.p1 TRINITY_DN7309_c0_g1~~TRINITY_DN7309_c0_g1_i1.p1  ORF type:complete len:1128 (+),score=201.40 TRINITY_DN7309_c0_g1_i1:430-3384(+)
MYKVTEASPVTVISEETKKKNKKNSIMRMTQAEAREFWETEFSDSDVNFVNVSKFMKRLKAYLAERYDVAVSQLDEDLLCYVLDIAKSGTLTPPRFSNFLQRFGPMKKMISRLKSVFSSPWFGGYMTFSESIRYLSEEPAGTFVIRCSYSKQDSFILDYVVNGDISKYVRSVVIKCHKPGTFTIEEEGGSVKFKKLQDIIEHYNDTLLTPYTNDLFSKPYFHGSMNKEEANNLLQRKPVGTFLLRYAENERCNFFIACSYVNDEYRTKHIFLLKVPSGYIVNKKKFCTKKRRSTSFKDSEIEGSDVIYTTIDIFLSSHKYLLKYPISQHGVPNLHIDKLNSDFDKHMIQDKEDCEMNVFKDFTAVKTISTYPSQSQGSRIVCDTYRGMIMGNRLIMSIADGCNWGNRSKEASKRAVEAFINHTCNAEIQSTINETDACNNILLQAIQKAHESIVEGKEYIWDAGSTTLLGTMLVKLEKEEQYMIIGVSVGDCKLFHWNSKTQSITDITYGNRKNARSSKDCGGRLGPTLEGGAPDLRNLSSYFWPCHEGDIFFLVSDGVYDNFDPEYLGLSPKDINLQQESWDEMETEEALSVKSHFVIEKMQELISSLRDITPSGIVDVLLENSLQVTLPSRSFMEADKDAEEPTDRKEYPGKMDHTTCASFLVKQYQKKKKILKVKLPSKKRSSTPLDLIDKKGQIAMNCLPPYQTVPSGEVVDRAISQPNNTIIEWDGFYGNSCVGSSKIQTSHFSFSTLENGINFALTNEMDSENGRGSLLAIEEYTRFTNANTASFTLPTQMLEACKKVQDKLMNYEETSSSNVTVLGGSIRKIKSIPYERSLGGLLLSIGDNKCFIYRRSDHLVEEVTKRAFTSGWSHKEIGTLGTELNLQDLEYFFFNCEVDDILFLFTPEIYQHFQDSEKSNGICKNLLHIIEHGEDLGANILEHINNSPQTGRKGSFFAFILKESVSKSANWINTLPRTIGNLYV